MNLDTFKRNIDCTITKWLHKNKKNCNLIVKPISLKQCTDWQLDNGVLRHVSKRFFSITGYVAEGNTSHLPYVEQPIIDQPEVGILGFLVRKVDRGWQWLIQAKAEPGNVNHVQGAPTVQATKSNYEMVHQGLPTPFLNCFLEPDNHQIILETDVEQSEQGDRFLNKYNRNCIATDLSGMAHETGNSFKWFSASALKNCLLQNYIINTDARSVLVCSDWGKLTDPGNAPFSKWRNQNHFGQLLYQSFSANNSLMNFDKVLSSVKRARNRIAVNSNRIPLEHLKYWSIEDRCVKNHVDADDFQIQYYDIQVQNREVNRWNQPLLRNTKQTDIALICSQIKGTLHFYFRLAYEPGFKNKVQLAPSIVDDYRHQKTDWCIRSIANSNTIRHASVLQSDEGGRFMNSIARYSIYEIDPRHANANDPFGVWLTLFQIKKLTSLSGYLTNEARSVLSLLLAWV